MRNPDSRRVNVLQAIEFNLTSAQFIVNGYLADLSDADLLVRPAAGANHIAWQLGHLIVAEWIYVDRAAPGQMPPLPAGFVEQHHKEKSTSNNPSDFLSKAEYQRLAAEVRASALAVIG